MTKEELFRAVGEVREDQIAEAEEMKQESRPWRRYGTMAACLALVLAGAFALWRLESEQKWAALEENFQFADSPESAPAGGGDTGGSWHAAIEPFHPGEDSGGEEEGRWPLLVVPFNPEEDSVGSDSESYWDSDGKRPGFHYSVNVEIGELVSAGAEKEPDAAGNRAEGFAACLAWLPPEEIFTRDTAIFRGIVRELGYYEVEEVCLGGGRTQYTAVAVEITDPIRGDLAAGEIRTVLYIGGPDTTTSLSGPLEHLKVGSEAIFMPERTSGETGVRNGASYFCYADLADFYLSEGLRFVFLDTGDGLSFERGVYEEIADAKTLEEVTVYIRRMIGEPERARPAAVPVEPQPAPSDTEEADPAVRSGPAGARELPGGTPAEDERRENS